MEQEIDSIINEDAEKAKESLKKFIKDASETFSFAYLDDSNKRQLLWNKILNLADSESDPEVLTACFSAVRILSREKRSLDELVTEDWLNLIKKHSGLGEGLITFDDTAKNVAVEVEKSLCNLVFNSRVVAAMCCENGVLDNLIGRLESNKEVPEILFFDAKLLFLITALCSETRAKVKDDMNGLKVVMGVLELVLKDAAERCLPNAVSLNDQDVDIACEILKALFNITLTSSVDGNTDEYAQLVTTLRLFLLVSVDKKEKSFMLKSNIINLLTNMSWRSYKNLITPVEPTQQTSKRFHWENNNMSAFYEILQFLNENFTNEPAISKQHETLSPVILVLLKGASTARPIRKYLRAQILPPLKDVHHRPEEGSTLRNHLCRLLTTPITQIRDLVAEFLFVLCKNNVSRMIKYTGYGNAAGLFAQRGLLGGRKDEGEAYYSSEDDDSETEEYAEHKHGINPVTGRFEAPHPNPMENMTEEQKEYEAMKLVELIDNMTKSGLIKPCRVGPDGKPQPIEHVLQLREGLKAQRNSDSDSD